MLDLGLVGDRSGGLVSSLVPFKLLTEEFNEVCKHVLDRGRRLSRVPSSVGIRSVF